MGFGAIWGKIERVHKLLERSECNLLNELNLFRIAQRIIWFGYIYIGNIKSS